MTRYRVINFLYTFVFGLVAAGFFLLYATKQMSGVAALVCAAGVMVLLAFLLPSRLKAARAELGRGVCPSCGSSSLRHYPDQRCRWFCTNCHRGWTTRGKELDPDNDS